MIYPNLTACSSGPEARICIFLYFYLVPFERKSFLAAIHIFPLCCDVSKTFIFSEYYYMIDRLIDFSNHTAVLFAELAAGKRCNFSAFPVPATKNKLHMGITTSDLMILSLRSTMCRAGMVVSPIYNILLVARIAII